MFLHESWLKSIKLETIFAFLLSKFLSARLIYIYENENSLK